MQKIAFILLLLVLGSYVEAQYTTNPVRLPSLQSLCVENSLDRTNLIDEQAQARNDEYMAGMQASFSEDGNTLILGLVTDINSGLNNLLGTATSMIIFIGPFIIGFVVILFIWPFLCCCCVCTSCCPSKCCQKPENEQYTKCELIWPSVVLILALLLSMIASVIGLVNAGDIEKSFKTTGCAFSITFDDVVNGNISSEGKFFAGISTFITELDKLNANLGTVKTQLDKVDEDGATITAITTPTTGSYPQFQQALKELSKGSGAANEDQVHADITYGALVTGGTSSKSTMPTILGRVSNTQSLLGVMSIVASATKDAVVSTSTAAKQFKDGVSSFEGSFAQTKATMNDFQATINEFDSGFGSTLATLDDVLAIITTAVTALFGVLIGLTVLGIIGAIIMTFCNKFGCRYLIYFTCVILFIIGIILFLTSIIFALLTPVLYYGCDFLTFSIASESNFQTNFKPILNDTADYISVCLPGGSGNILDKLGADLTGSLDGLSEAMSGMDNFGQQDFSSQVRSSWKTLKDKIENFHTGKELDLDAAQPKNQLIKLADPGQWTCSETHFSTDSWVPNPATGSQIGCKTGSAVSTCSSSAFTTSPYTGCKGCMDTYGVLQSQSPTAPGAALDSRYPNSNCDAFNDALVLAFNEYYVKKAAGYSALMTRLSSTNSGEFTTFANNVDAVQAQFESVFKTLTTSINSIVDPKYGLLAGLNCLIFGEDFNVLVKTICVQFFNTTYLSRLTLGITAFGILFAMCCSVCTGVRHYKHSQRAVKLDSLGSPGEGTTAGFVKGY